MHFDLECVQVDVAVLRHILPRHHDAIGELLPADLCAETDKTGIQVNKERRNPRQVEVIRQCFGVIGVAGGERDVTVAADMERRIAGSVEFYRLPAQGHRRGVIVPEEQRRPATRIDRQIGDGIGRATVDIRRTVGSQGQAQVGEIVVASEEFREIGGDVRRGEGEACSAVVVGAAVGGLVFGIHGVIVRRVIRQARQVDRVRGVITVLGRALRQGAAAQTEAHSTVGRLIRIEGHGRAPRLEVGGLDVGDDWRDTIGGSGGRDGHIGTALAVVRIHVGGGDGVPVSDA